ncbi:MAG: glycosyltransferase family 25 protein [Pseudomonadota bacterium]
MTDLPVFLINLDGSDARLAAARTALQAQGIAFVRIAAHDGRGQAPQEVPAYSSAGTRAKMGRDLTGGEVGCYLSHIRAAQAFVDTGAPFGLVLEDDIAPSGQAQAVITALLRWQTARGTPDWHLCHLGAWRDKYTTPLATLPVGDAVIKRAHYFPVTTPALLWTRAGAQAFLDLALPITAPVDHILRTWLTRTDMGIAVTPHVFKTTQTASDIDSAQAKRHKDGRSPLYGWLKAKRMYGDKWRAWQHQRRRARAATADRP